MSHENSPPLNANLPWTRSCFVCGQDNPHGLNLRSRIEDGIVVLDYTTRDADRGYQHIMHGGIAMTLLDEVMTWAAILSAGKVCVAAEMSTRLRKPIRVPQLIRVEGWITRATSRLLVTEGRILDAEGQVLLFSTGKYMPMPGDQVMLAEKDFVESPDVLMPRHFIK
jgi:uncharacterized protein (TIGR00369 family)